MHRLPRTKVELARLLENATVAGYTAGLNDSSNGEWTNKPKTDYLAIVRRKIRAELWR